MIIFKDFCQNLTVKSIKHIVIVIERYSKMAARHKMHQVVVDRGDWGPVQEFV